MIDYEQTEQEILRLINEAPENRALLMIMFRQQQSLVENYHSLAENTAMTRRIAASVEDQAKLLRDHADEEMVLINQIRGGWRVALAASGIVAGLLGAIQVMLKSDFESLRAQVAINTNRLYIVERDNMIEVEKMQRFLDHLTNGRMPQ